MIFHLSRRTIAGSGIDLLLFSALVNSWDDLNVREFDLDVLLLDGGLGVMALVLRSWEIFQGLAEPGPDRLC